ncbi:MAG: EamA family transporter [Deltaproteobacteria bacterium]|nr:EamA family transporter [Deltaproteobacteria bacterium]
MSKSTIYILMFSHIFLSAGTYIFGKAAAISFPNPLIVTSYRAFGAMVIFLILSGKVIPKPTFSKKDWFNVFLLGILLVPLNQFCFLYGIQYTVPSHPALFYSLTPIGVLICYSIIKLKFPKSLEITGIIISLIGVLIILRPWESGNSAQELRTGDIWILGAVLSWIIYTVFAGHMCKKYDAIVVTSWSLILGAVILSPYVIYSFINVNFSTIPVKAWLSLSWLIIITSVVMMLVWNILLKYLNPVKVSISSNLQPPATVMLAVLLSLTGFLDSNQDTGLIFFAGMLLILSGVTILQFVKD